MAKVAEHLSLAELQAGYRTSEEARLARHYQVIWLLAQGRSCAEVAPLTSLARRLGSSSCWPATTPLGRPHSATDGGGMAPSRRS